MAAATSDHVEHPTATALFYGYLVAAIAGAFLGAIAALFSISGSNPWWSLAVFFLCIYVIHGIFIYGTEAPEPRP